VNKTESSFDKLQLLSQEDVIVEALNNILKANAELIRRDEALRVFLKELCSLSVETRIWWCLFEAGGSQKFTDIQSRVKCSKGKLILTLRELEKLGKVRIVGRRYQAISPPYLVHILD